MRNFVEESPADHNAGPRNGLIRTTTVTVFWVVVSLTEACAVLTAVPAS